jgi:hypothetical protein
VLRSIFGPKKDEETGEWKRLHNEKLNNNNNNNNNTAHQILFVRSNQEE